jgi:hypothetical protein
MELPTSLSKVNEATVLKQAQYRAASYRCKCDVMKYVHPLNNKILGLLLVTQLKDWIDCHRHRIEDGNKSLTIRPGLCPGERAMMDAVRNGAAVVWEDFCCFRAQ